MGGGGGGREQNGHDKHKDKEQLGQRMAQAKEDNKRTGRTNSRKPESIQSMSIYTN